MDNINLMYICKHIRSIHLYVFFFNIIMNILKLFLLLVNQEIFSNKRSNLLSYILLSYSDKKLTTHIKQNNNVYP